MLNYLQHGTGTRKEYDFVKFTNGYGKDKPYFIAEYEGFEVIRLGHIKEGMVSWEYTNGLVVRVRDYDYAIHLGEILEKGNIKQ